MSAYQVQEGDVVIDEGVAEGQRTATVATTKTLLWTNPSPNSNFASQTINLSSSLSSFTHMIIRYKVSTGSTQVYDNLFNVNPLRTSDSTGRYGINIITSGSVTYVRPMYSAGTNAIFSGNAVNLSSTQGNNFLIPLEIYGISISYD